MTVERTDTISPGQAASLAGMALACLGREYPNQIAHAMGSDADAGTPRSLHPAFFGAYDWHSAVHGHWCLARLLRVAGEGSAWAGAARRALEVSLTPGNMRRELEYLLAEGRAGFERPYGLAWLLRLDAELRAWPGSERAWLRAISPLSEACGARLLSWVEKLTHPVRSGVHSQSAFAMSLALDWARVAGERGYAERMGARARALHGGDSGWRLAFEPSGEDFLSPSLGAADLMRRVLSPGEFAAWLGEAVPELGAGAPLRPVSPLDPRDGRLAHLDGLSLSRAWMLEAIARALPAGDARVAPVRALADEHLRAGMESLRDADYVRAHWLATFAVYALTARGLD